MGPAVHGAGQATNGRRKWQPHAGASTISGHDFAPVSRQIPMSASSGPNSVYGPSIDTGGLPANHAPTIYAYPHIAALLEGEARGGAKA